MDETIMGAGRENRATHSRSNSTARQSSDALEIGTVLANRYEIVRMDRRGRMGCSLSSPRPAAESPYGAESHPPGLGQRSGNREPLQAGTDSRPASYPQDVIRIYDLAEFDGLKFITMDFIDGRDLKTVLRANGKFEPRRAAENIEQVCRGLEAAHSEAVIHRDLKPQNIMMDRSGKITVMDFGIAGV